MTGKHYAFHKRWTVDMEARTALHESGLLVEFTPKTGAGFVKVSTEQPALDYLSAKNGRGNAGVMLERLKREASDVYLWAKEQGKS
nr:hypothetical protein [uncultured Rhodoferax sp.]